jgi:polyisoprenyl-phosphate glycosyltransferase
LIRSGEGRAVSGETLSIVVPAHNEEANVDALFRRLDAALRDNFAGQWRMIFIDDGSEDETWARIVALSRADSRVTGIRLTRNFGHQNALLAGLAAAKGRAVITMDADLQHPAEIVPRMLAAWSDGARVVYTRREDSAGTGLFKRATSRLFYRILSSLTERPIPPGTSDFRLLDRGVVDEVLRVRETQMFLRGLIPWMGFRSATVPYVAPARARGRSSFGLGRMAGLALTGVTSMSSRPLRWSGMLGCFAALLCLCELGFVLYAALIARSTVPGWASILVVVTFFFAILFLCLGILGEYLARVFENLKVRPRFIVDETVNAAEEKVPEPRP